MTCEKPTSYDDSKHDNSFLISAMEKRLWSKETKGPPTTKAIEETEGIDGLLIPSSTAIWNV